MNQPSLSLTYKPETHQFVFTVSELTSFEYQLVYQLRLSPEQEVAQTNNSSSSTSLLKKLLINSPTPVISSSSAVILPAKTQFSVQGRGKVGEIVTILAGSESSGHQYLHDPESGTLTITNSASQSAGYKITQDFVIDQLGKLTITNTQLATQSANQPHQHKGDVLGSQTKMLTTATTAPPQYQPTLNETPTTNQLQFPLLTIILVVLGLATVAASIWVLIHYWQKKQGRTTTAHKAYFVKDDS